jgi:hypothetical protein
VLGQGDVEGVELLRSGVGRGDERRFLGVEGRLLGFEGGDGGRAGLGGEPGGYR